MLGDSLGNANDKGHLCFDSFLNTCGGQWWSSMLSVAILVHTRCKRIGRKQEDSLRDEDRGCICSRLFNSIADFGKYWLSQMCLSSFLWICTTDDIGSYTPSIPYSVPYLNVVNTVINGLLGVEAVQILANARASFAFLMTHLPCLPVKPWKMTLVSLFTRRFSAVAA